MFLGVPHSRALHRFSRWEIQVRRIMVIYPESSLEASRSPFHLRDALVPGAPDILASWLLHPPWSGWVVRLAVKRMWKGRARGK